MNRFAKSSSSSPRLGLVVGLGLGLAAVGAGCADVVTYSKNSRRAGIARYQEGDYLAAAGAFRNATRQNPRDYKSHYHLAASHAQLGQYQQAIQAYKASLDTQRLTLEGREDTEFRPMAMDGLASAIARSDTRGTETAQLEARARTSQNPEEMLLLAKVYRYQGDADLALDAYNRAALLAPDDFQVHKEYGLMLEQVGQPRKAEIPLKRAYSLNGGDADVVAALRRIGVVPGPALLREEQLAKPPVPKGPIPEIEWSRIGRQGNTDAAAEPAIAPTPPPAPTMAETVQAPRD